jgi:hypothetical protein
VAEVNYSTFDRELLTAHQAINHFLRQVDGRVVLLWTDHKPLVAAMTRVTPIATPGLHFRTHLQHVPQSWHGQRSGGRFEGPTYVFTVIDRNTRWFEVLP